VPDRAVSRRGLDVAFAVVVAVMAAHEAEHVAQLLQKEAFPNRCPGDCRGALGFIFDVEWIHFSYNVSILAAVAGLAAAYGLWRSSWRQAHPWAVGALTAGIVIQGYHVVEHVAKLDQWFANGHHSPTPVILGQGLSRPEAGAFSLVELHFLFNTTVFLLVLAGYFGLGFARRAWPVSGRLGAVPAAATVAVLILAPVAGAWATRTPTTTLAAGVHEGPLVLDRKQALVGEPGAVVRGGIVITADGVTVRGVTVLAGENGIEVDGAQNVALEGVRVAGASLDGIHVRRGSVTIRDCLVHSPTGEYAQGIDISFSIDLAPSFVEGCSIVGGYEGIVTHSALVTIRDNHVRNTSLRGITITEMSMGTAEKNEVRDALGVGIYCGDYSHCMIDRNSVSGTRPDLASSNGTRMGYAILAVFGAEATVRGNELTKNYRRTRAFADAMIHPVP
jgi:hypothetical protein